jgi:hypothetical protein
VILSQKIKKEKKEGKEGREEGGREGGREEMNEARFGDHACNPST